MKSNFFEKDFYGVRILTDFAAISLSFFLISIFSLRNTFFIDREVLVALIIAWYVSSKWIDVYNDFRTLKFIDELLLLTIPILIQGLVLILAFFILDSHEHARRFVLEYCGLLSGILVIKKYVLKKTFQYLRKTGSNVKNVLIIGSTEVGMSFYEFIKANPHFGYNPVGFVDSFKDEKLNGQYKGTIEEIEKIIVSFQVDEIIVALPNFDKVQLNSIINICERKAIRTRIIPEYFRFNSNKFKMEMFGNFPMVLVRDEPLNQSFPRIVKRLTDIVLSLAVCVFVLSWLIPIIAVLIKMDSKGSVFFIQDRWGQDNQLFQCFKFRTMKIESRIVVDGKFQQTQENDCRITKIGAFLRKTSLDELPQFVNVLLGNMSIVGPRPHAVPHNEESQCLINNYSIRHWVKPGITGWAQVNGLRGETKDFQLMRRRVEFDIWYIENWTPWLDVKIFSMTVYDFVKGDLKAY
ncbi:MAG: undecaprenyl-phosphate glucose phosphotransferase [Bacteroidota bacterium]|jgi:putative colanic acid biosynthesis UDP-glucose lipid carrier transferase